jgi:exopolysaccharide biosynthesis WecB/TagA/CpsF family protein
MKKILDLQGTLDITSGYLITINLQHLYESYKNSALRDIIFNSKSASLCIDGRGSLILFQLYVIRDISLVAGNVLLKKILMKNSLRVLVVGSSVDVISDVSNLYKNVHFEQDISRYNFLDENYLNSRSRYIYESYGDNFDVITLALGTPKQEMLAKSLVNYYSRTPILCIGGSFEMLAGHYPRCPEILQKIGMEGFWRLILQPNMQRFKRVMMTYYYFLFFLFQPSKLKQLVGNFYRE